MIDVRWARPVAVAGALLSASLPAVSAEKGTNRDNTRPAEVTANVKAVDTAHTAQSLARYADVNSDALAMIVAARMMKSVGGKPGEFKRIEGAAGQAKTPGDHFSVPAMLDRARKLAGDRKDLLALVDDVAQSGERSPPDGPKYARTVVRTGSVHRYEIVFRGGEPAAVAIAGDGDSDLDLYVYDENGNKICSSTGSSDREICRWHPKWTGPFIIRVRNRGVANQYYLRTN